LLRRFYGELARRAEEKERRFRRFIEDARRMFPRQLTLILFGSRARGEQTMLSDYDLLAICDAQVYEKLLETRPIGVQLFHIDPGSLEGEMRRFNTILVDAALEGKPMHDGLGVWGLLRRMAWEEVRRRRLEKTRAGWLPKRQ